MEIRKTDSQSRTELKISLPAPSCTQLVSQTVDSLPANSYFSSIASLDLAEATDTLSISSSSSQHRFTAPSLLRGTSPNNGPRLMSPPTYESLAADWRGGLEHRGALEQQQAAAWNPLNYGISGSDTWKPMSWPPGNTSGAVGDGVPSRGVGGSGPLCGSCTDQHLVTSRCRDCSEDLCDSCVVAHQRVKLTREHTIVRYPDNSSVSKPPGFFNHVNGVHPVQAAPVGSKGPGPAANADVIRVFNETVEKAKLENQANIEMARRGYDKCEKALEMKAAMERQILQKTEQVKMEIELSKNQQIHAVEERHRALWQRLVKIKEVKVGALVAQEKEVRQAMLLLNQVLATLERAASSGDGMEVIDVNKKASETIMAMQQSCGNLKPHEDDEILFRPAPPELVTNLASAGVVASSGFAPNCIADGDGLTRGVLGKEAKFSVMVKDHLNEPNLTRSTDGPKLDFISPDGRPINFQVAPDLSVPGKFDVRWRPHLEGEHQINISLKGVKLPESPYKCTVRAGRDYHLVGTSQLEFGREGAQEGELCRPWGVCCTPTGLICVADRSPINIFPSNLDLSNYVLFEQEQQQNSNV